MSHYILLAIGLVMAGVTVRDAWSERTALWPRFRAVVSHMRWYMLPEVLVAVTLTIIVGVAVSEWLPWTEHGWTYLVAGTDTNVTLALPQATPLWVGVPYLGLLFLYMPSITLAEEKSFRKGCDMGWGYTIFQALVFGPLHCIAGIPISFGVALIVAGLFFGWKYRRAHARCTRTTEGVSDGVPWKLIYTNLTHAENEALLTSAAYHTVWNWVALSMLLFLLLFLP